MKKFFYWLLVAFLAAMLAVQVYERQKAVPPTDKYEVIDSATEVVEKPDTTPVCRDSVVIRYQYVDVPLTPPPDISTDSVGDDKRETEYITAVQVSEDSVAISIPITQRKYETEDYRAYVSGYNARLDSIFVNSKSTVITIREPAKRKRFSVGLQAGYGMTPKGFQPYVGVGVSVNLFNF